MRVQPKPFRRRWLLPAVGAAVLVAAAAVLLWRLEAPPPVDPAAPVLADNAGDVLVRLAYSAGRFRVELTGIDRKPVSGATVNLALQPLSGQGGGRAVPARGTLKSGVYAATATLEPAGRWRVVVSLARRGRPEEAVPFDFTYPWPAAAAPLAQADAAMGRLKSMRQKDWFGYGPKTEVTDFAFIAPDRMHLQTGSGFERYAFGAVMYERDPGEAWHKGDWPGLHPFRWPDWSYAPDAAEVHVIDREVVDGHPCVVISFLYRPSAARFRWWVDESSFLVHRSVMMATGHYMRDRYYDFDAPLRIEPPAP